MDGTLFRKTSMERLKSPEQLNEYIRVANPGIWLILAAVVLLLTGVVVWGVFGAIDTRIDMGVVVRDGAAYGYVSEEDGAGVQSGTPVIMDGMEAVVAARAATPEPIGGEAPYLLHLSGLSAGQFCYELEISGVSLEDGMYPAELVVESVNPITFVIQ